MAVRRLLLFLIFPFCCGWIAVLVASLCPIWTVWYYNPMEGLGYRRTLWGVMWEVLQPVITSRNKPSVSSNSQCRTKRPDLGWVYLYWRNGNGWTGLHGSAFTQSPRRGSLSRSAAGPRPQAEGKAMHSPKASIIVIALLAGFFLGGLGVLWFVQPSQPEPVHAQGQL